MPLFKKVSIDTGSMLETHRQSLRRCRLVFLKDLDVSQVMDYMATDEGFRQEQRDTILACPTREQRVATFLDYLESRGERAFGLFVEALKLRYRHLYAFLEETIQTIDERDNSQHCEKASVSGIVLRRMLQKHRIAAQNSEESETVIDKISSDLQGSIASNYIDCYSITAKGRLQKDKWIVHSDDCKPYSSQKNEKSYMAVVCANVICRQIDWSTAKLPPDFKKTPNDSMPAYVFEKEGSFVLSSISRQTSHDVGDSVMTGHRRREKTDPGNKRDMLGCIPTASFRLRSSMPPPVPPKPENLPIWGIAGCPPLPKPRSASDTQSITPPPRTTSKISLPNGQVKPPVPKNKPCILIPQSQSAHSALTTRTKFSDIPSLSEEMGGKTRILKSSSLIERNFYETDSEDADRVSLDYNVSVASTLEPEDEAKDDEDVRDDSDTANEEPEAGGSVQIVIVNGTTSSQSQLDINKNRTKASTGEQMSEEYTEQVWTQGLDEQMPDELQGSEIQIKEELINNEQVQALEQEQTDDQADNEQQMEQPCDVLSLPVTDAQLSTAEESTEEVKYDLPPREDLEDDVSRKTGNDSDTPNADDQFVRLPKPSVDQPAFADDEFSSDNSYYEEIEQFFVDCPSPSVQSCAAYLDPCTSSLRKRASNRSSHHYALDEFRKSGRKFLCRNSLLLVEMDSSCLDSKSVSDHLNSVFIGEPEQEQTPSDVFKGTVLGFDREGFAFYVPSHLLKKYGEPEGEPWFYPISMTSRQASLFLSSVRQEGCFIVYCPQDNKSNVAYNLSVCLANGDVVHYHILENIHGDFGIEGHDHSFMTVSELVEYFRRNKSSLATRLRRPLRCAKHPITPGYHYDLRYELNRNDLSLTGNIIGQGNFGVVCSGLYRNMPVAVKVLQKSDNLTPADEDDFIEEALAMMELRHDHIVRLVGVSCKLRPCFLVTEYMQKGNLKDCLRNGVIQSDNIDVLFDVCIQLVSSMQYLESLRFMLHRDLAARNFLVDDHLSIKLADFGRARLVSDDCYQAPRTEKLCIKWASPEVLIYSHYSTKSDVWALGVVFWEVFSSGARPFSLFSGEQTAMYVTGGGRLDKPPGCPPDLYDMMKSCWMEEPDDRPSFHDLDEVLKSKSSIYYSKPSIPTLDNRRPVADGTKQVSPLPSKQKTPSGKSVTSRTSTGTNSRKSNVCDKGSKCDTTNENLLRSKSDARYILNHEGPFTNYLSDLSITTVSSEITDIDQYVSRGDRIRESIRKLINKKSKTKISDLGGRAVHVSQDCPAAQ